jgi:hypothetical protein
MTENNAPKLPSGQTVTWREDGLVTHYANLMALSMTPFDISLMFGEVGKATIEEVEGIARAKIILSPEQALNLMKLLSLAVEKYIQGNGPLRVSGAINEAAFSEALNQHLVGKTK